MGQGCVPLFLSLHELPVDVSTVSQHASSAMASVCTGKVIQDYFFKGELPPNGLVCPTNEVLFPPAENATNAMAWMTADVQNMDDQRLLQNLKALGEAMQPYLMRRRR
jgi:hypothetical protein